MEKAVIYKNVNGGEGLEAFMAVVRDDAGVTLYSLTAKVGKRLRGMEWADRLANGVVTMADDAEQEPLLKVALDLHEGTMAYDRFDARRMAEVRKAVLDAFAKVEPTRDFEVEVNLHGYGLSVKVRRMEGVWEATKYDTGYGLDGLDGSYMEPMYFRIADRCNDHKDVSCGKWMKAVLDDMKNVRP